MLFHYFITRVSPERADCAVACRTEALRAGQMMQRRKAHDNETAGDGQSYNRRCRSGGTSLHAHGAESTVCRVLLFWMSCSSLGNW